MALMDGIQRWQPAMMQRPGMQFMPTGTVSPVDAAGFETPQQRFERQAAERKAAGGTGVRAVDDTMASAGGAGSQGNKAVDPLAPLPEGAAVGGAPVAAGGGGVGAGAPAAAAGAGGSGGIMGAIMKMLPMLMGG